MSGTLLMLLLGDDLRDGFRASARDVALCHCWQDCI